MHTQLFIIVGIGSLISLVVGHPLEPRGECILKRVNMGYNGMREIVNVGEKVTNTKFCRSQGEGDWTFAMYNELDYRQVGIHRDPSKNLQGLSEMSTFMIMGNDCILRGGYQEDRKNDNCGIGKDMLIEDNYLPLVIVITSVWQGASDPEVKFAYGDGVYASGTKHFDCQHMESGLNIGSVCVSAFPLDGSSD